MRQTNYHRCKAAWFQPPGREQLYDLRDDPHEINNLAADPKFADVLAHLSQQLDDFLSRVGDTSEVAEQTLKATISRKWNIAANPSAHGDLAKRQSAT